MRNDFINISSKDKQYPMYITSIEVDKIINALLGKANQDEKNAIEEFISKCNELFNGVSNIGGAIDAIKSISLLFGQ